MPTSRWFVAACFPVSSLRNRYCQTRCARKKTRHKSCIENEHIGPPESQIANSVSSLPSTPRFRCQQFAGDFYGRRTRGFVFHFCANFLVMLGRREGKGISKTKYEYTRVRYNTHRGKCIDSAASPVPFQETYLIHVRKQGVQVPQKKLDTPLHCVFLEHIFCDRPLTHII